MFWALFDGLSSWSKENKPNTLQFDFSTIRAATDDFSEANKLGQGGFGAVYKILLYNLMQKL